MMGERKLGAGMLYIGSLDGDNFEPLCVSTEGSVLYTVEDDCGVAIHQIATDATAEFTLNLSKQQMLNLMCEVYGFKKLALDQMRESGHGRIAHLATRARKRKTRKKNLHRAYSALRIP